MIGLEFLRQGNGFVGVEKRKPEIRLLSQASPLFEHSSFDHALPLRLDVLKLLYCS